MKLNPMVLVAAAVGVVLVLFGVRALLRQDGEPMVQTGEKGGGAAKGNAAGDASGPGRPLSGPGAATGGVNGGTGAGGNVVLGPDGKPLAQDGAVPGGATSGAQPPRGPATIEEVRAQEDPELSTRLDAITKAMDDEIKAKSPLTPETYQAIMTKYQDTARQVIAEARKIAEAEGTPRSKEFLDTYGRRLTAYKLQAYSGGAGK